MGLDYTSNMKEVVRLILLILSICISPSYSEVLEIRHPVPQDAQEPHRSYYIQLLALAFDKADVEVSFRSVPSSLSQERLLLALNGDQMDVMWTMTSKEREQIAMPIRVPLMKGLLGYRVLVIHKANLSRFENITSLEDWKRLNGVQGHDWPDTKILRENGLLIKTSTWFPDMYRQLSVKKVDYFPRGVLEFSEELDKYAYPDLVVVPNQAIYYPTALYFFVANSNKNLGKIIERGLKMAIRDGSFDRLFYSYPEHGKALEQFDYKDARVYRLENTSLPKSTPLNKPDYWLKIN